jgi:2-amino-4-hydroxy-6-hydroxymethyldihydropteridine diphosphokinase
VTRAYVGLGSNLGDREATIRRALELLDERVAVEAVSTLRETEPWGYEQQPPFLNGVAAVETKLAPHELLDVLLGVERLLGRERGGGPRYGPRAIDLDLLVYGDEIVDEPGLTIPHPHLHERRFALEPLEELDPDLFVPGQGRVSDLLAALH